MKRTMSRKIHKQSCEREKVNAPKTHDLALPYARLCSDSPSITFPANFTNTPKAFSDDQPQSSAANYVLDLLCR